MMKLVDGRVAPPSSGTLCSMMYLEVIEKPRIPACAQNRHTGLERRIPNRSELLLPDPGHNFLAATAYAQSMPPSTLE